MSKWLRIFAVVFFAVSCGEQNDTLSKMVIETSDGPVTYYVETAATKEEMAKGLMNRQTLKADSGMIFALQGQQEIAMWMKDTLIPLDMLFVSVDGVIMGIVENAQPNSTALIYPEKAEPLSAVVELNGGDVAKHQIKVGDKVKHRVIQ